MMDEEQRIRDLFWQGYSYDHILFKLEQEGYVLSLSTLKRRLKHLALGRRNYATINTIEDAVITARQNGCESLVDY